jgi:hypothetical protein
MRARRNLGTFRAPIALVLRGLECNAQEETRSIAQFCPPSEPEFEGTTCKRGPFFIGDSEVLFPRNSWPDFRKCGQTFPCTIRLVKVGAKPPKPARLRRLPAVKSAPGSTKARDTGHRYRQRRDGRGHRSWVAISCSAGPGLLLKERLLPSRVNALGDRWFSGKSIQR